MVNWELAEWVLVNLGVPVLAATLIALILLITPWSQLWLKMMRRSVSEGQLYWVAVAFCASALSEASEYRDLAGPDASMFPWTPILWLLVVVTLIAGVSFTLIHASKVEARKAATLKNQVTAMGNAVTCSNEKDGVK